MNSATIITSTRLVLALIFSFFFMRTVHGGLFTPDMTYLLLSISCVVLIELSDLLDGLVARSRNEVTHFGKIFDPLCDSVSRQTIFCTFMLAGIIPLWMFFIFMYRDSFLSFLRIICAYHGTVMAAKKSGKLKAVLQGASILLVLLTMVGHHYAIVPRQFWGMHPGFWIVLPPALFTALSLFDYLLPNIALVQKMMRPDSEKNGASKR